MVRIKRTEQDVIDEINQYKGKYYPGTKMIINGFAGRNERRQILVECTSESRGTFKAVWSEVKRGNTKGTLKGELRIQRNHYEIEQDIVRVFFDSDTYFICDIQDIQLVENYTWHLNQNGYARSSEKLYFHRLIMNCPDGYIIDHINRDKLDNRRCNLRICKKIDNSHNMNMFSTNTSGHTGVHQTKSGKYESTIVANYQTIRLGLFENYDDACDAYDNAKGKYHYIMGGDL